MFFNKRQIKNNGVAGTLFFHVSHFFVLIVNFACQFTAAFNVNMHSNALIADVRIELKLFDIIVRDKF
ncbi:hypothetical protein SDC9_143277 [bioreactor metagenome]|uniref:Uncharacterized protein n=1 Tax=bioreactor metagenome TaxID=1076179 RepID=A0A645E2W9_9ZZZZ